MANSIFRALLSFAGLPLAFLWCSFVTPWIARRFGVPVNSAWWTKERQNQHLTKPQFIWIFGVLELGLGYFIWITLRDAAGLFVEKNRHFGSSDITFALGMCLFMGVVVGFICAPSQADESPVTGLHLAPNDKSEPAGK